MNTQGVDIIRNRDVWFSLPVCSEGPGLLSVVGNELGPIKGVPNRLSKTTGLVESPWGQWMEAVMIMIMSTTWSLAG